MTKRRPSNKKPTGLNKSLGNTLSNERDRNRKLHQRAKYDGKEIENPAFMEKEEKKVIDSITDETSLEEFLAKAQLAGTEFTADRDQVRVIENETRVVVPTRLDLKNNQELQKQFEHRLRIPRRPAKELWSSVEELTRLENDNFLKWRTDLADLQEVDGLALTPFERNPDMWRELWRVVEKSDIIVQIVDARNPLLFRSKDLDDYVKEVDPAKQVLLLVNKADLLEPSQQKIWADYFVQANINVVFWSALDDEPKTIPEEMEVDGELRECIPIPSTSSQIEGVEYLHEREDLITLLKKIGHVSDEPGLRPLVVGMCGYPNVGKSSTINKLAGGKKVSVSATPGKTRHFQTIHIDKQLCLCDCPGLVMPSFTFGRSEMFLNGILPVDQMRDHFGPTALLLSRVPTPFLEKMYSIMLPDNSKTSALNLLTSMAFMRGFMSSSGIPDCSRAGRLLIKDVVSGKVRWVAAPPGIDQTVFDEILYPQQETSSVGKVQLETLQKRGLLDGESEVTRGIDNAFFTSTKGRAHARTKFGSDAMPIGGGSVPENSEVLGDKKHKKGKKDKLRRVFVTTY